MPTLIASAWTAVHPVLPYVWSCSECDAAFDIGRQRLSSLTREQVDGVNLQFEAHCKHMHPLSFAVVGLNAKS
jgi:hypothetical protein